ncbi:MAG: hypothetical protein JEY96_01455 [Bacteroidales bacterium]|nr:hypothetical protein [Bacteroidales bacterium]
MKPIFKFIYKWSEVLILPLALLIFWISRPLLRMVDQQAGVYDWGIFQVFLFATVGFFFGIAVVRLGLKLLSPHFEKWFDNEFPKIWTSTEISLWQKSKISVYLFSLYLLFFALLVRVVA